MCLFPLRNKGACSQISHDGVWLSFQTVCLKLMPACYYIGGEDKGIGTIDFRALL